MAAQDQMALLNETKQNKSKMSQGKAREYSCQSDLPLFFGFLCTGSKVQAPQERKKGFHFQEDSGRRKRPWLTQAPAPLLDAWGSVCVRTCYSLHPDISSRSSVKLTMLVFIPHLMQLIKSTKKKRKKKEKETEKEPSP